MVVVTDISTPLYSRRKFRHSIVNATFYCWNKLEALLFGLVGVSSTEKLSISSIPWDISGIFLKDINIFSLLLLDFDNIWQRRVCVVTIYVTGGSIVKLKACAVFFGHSVDHIQFRIMSDRAFTRSLLLKHLVWIGLIILASCLVTHNKNIIVLKEPYFLL